MPTTHETFAILGLSKFGFRTAVGLFERGARVVAVDKDERLIQKISQRVTKAIQADATDLDVMQHVGAFDVDTVVIAFRSAFDAAVLLAYHVRLKTKVKRIVAQVDTDEKAEALKLIGVDLVVFPESDTADRTVQRLLTPDLVEQILLGPSEAIVELPAPDEYLGRTLTELQIRARYGIYVIAIKRSTGQGEPKDVLVAPPPDTRFAAGDTMLLLGARQRLQELAADIKKE